MTNFLTNNDKMIIRGGKMATEIIYQLENCKTSEKIWACSNISDMVGKVVKYPRTLGVAGDCYNVIAKCCPTGDFVENKIPLWDFDECNVCCSCHDNTNCTSPISFTLGSFDSYCRSPYHYEGCRMPVSCEAYSLARQEDGNWYCNLYVEDGDQAISVSISAVCQLLTSVDSNFNKTHDGKWLVTFTASWDSGASSCVATWEGCPQGGYCLEDVTEWVNTSSYPMTLSTMSFGDACGDEQCTCGAGSCRDNCEACGDGSLWTFEIQGAVLNGCCFDHGGTLNTTYNGFFVKDTNASTCTWTGDFGVGQYPSIHVHAHLYCGSDGYWRISLSYDANDLGACDDYFAGVYKAAECTGQLCPPLGPWWVNAFNQSTKCHNGDPNWTYIPPAPFYLESTDGFGESPCTGGNPPTALYLYTTTPCP